jgi:hypothetical protein
MIRPNFQFALVTLTLLVLCSCSGKRDYGKETFAVTGEVYVDGQPAADLAVTLHPVNGMDAEVPTVSATFTRADGTFSLSTFEKDDGVPAGEYVATFAWGEMNPLSMTFDDSKLKGKYSDPKKSTVNVTVTKGQPTEMGRIDLTTQ